MKAVLIKKDVDRMEFFKHLLRLINVSHNQGFVESEIKVLACLMVDKNLTETGIQKNNLYSVIDKLKVKGFLNEEGELNRPFINYKQKFTDKQIELSIIFDLYEEEEKA